MLIESKSTADSGYRRGANGGCELLAASDRDGQAGWIRVMEAVDELLSKERPADGSVH